MEIDENLIKKIHSACGCCVKNSVQQPKCQQRNKQHKKTKELICTNGGKKRSKSKEIEANRIEKIVVNVLVS